MIMKSFCAFLMVLFFTTMPIFAQEQPPSDAHQPLSTVDIVAKMQSKLSLTQDQVTAVTPIIEKYFFKRNQLRQTMENATANKDGIRSQMKQLKEDEKQELSQFFSSGQMSQWEKMQSKGKHRHGDGGNGGVD